MIKKCAWCNTCECPHNNNCKEEKKCCAGKKISHGICENCAKKLIDNYNLKKNQREIS